MRTFIMNRKVIQQRHYFTNLLELFLELLLGALRKRTPSVPMPSLSSELARE